MKFCNDGIAFVGRLKWYFATFDFKRKNLIKQCRILLGVKDILRPTNASLIPRLPPVVAGTCRILVVTLVSRSQE